MRFTTIVPAFISVLSLLSLLMATPIQGATRRNVATTVLRQQHISQAVAPTKAPTTPVFSPVAQKIAKYAPGGLTSFVPGSYQLKALQYVESVSNANNLADSKAVQLYALACFYYSTYGVTNPVWESPFPALAPPGWFNSKNWLNPTVDPCSGGNGKKVWNGITCVNKKITRIELPSNQLIGSIPDEIALLASNNPSRAGKLNYIDLFNNHYLLIVADTGNSWIGRLGPSMQYLYLGTTSLYSTAGVPDAIGRLVNLVELDVSYTLISGPLRSIVFAPLTKLQYLELDGNAYNSSIPTAIGTLPSLKNLYVINAYVSGDLSFTVGMKNIRELWVGQNSIAGKIPTTLGNVTTLESLDVSHNLLSGGFPTQLANLVDMKQMFFHSNKLSGAFPNSYTTMTKLMRLQLENNKRVTGDASTLCNALSPFGQLESIGIDCTTNGGKVKCSNCTKCCCSLTACGDAL